MDDKKRIMRHREPPRQNTIGQKAGEPKGRTPLWYWIIQLLMLGTALGASVLLGVSLWRGMKPKREPVTVLENKIREIQELALVRQVYRDVIYARAGKTFTSEILFSIDYHIVAGMNLSRGVELEPREDGSLLCRLPEPEILSIDADDNSILQYYIRESFRAVKQSDYMSLIVSEKEELTRSAIESGILLRARRNGELLLLRLFRLSGYETVRFEYIPVNTNGQATGEEAS